nr:hypothetical protein [Rhizobium leguminosarum]
MNIITLASSRTSRLCTIAGGPAASTCAAVAQAPSSVIGNCNVGTLQREGFGNCAAYSGIGAGDHSDATGERLDPPAWTWFEKFSIVLGNIIHISMPC